MRKILVLVVLLIGLALVSTVFSVVQASASEGDIRHRVAEVGTGMVFVETWPATYTGTVELDVEFPHSGIFEITAGSSAITSPVSIDGEVIEVYFLEGEVAAYFTGTFEVEAGQVMKIQATRMPTGSQIVLWYNYELEPTPTPTPTPTPQPTEFKAFLPLIYRQQCRTIEISPAMAAMILEKWEAAPYGYACLVMKFNQNGKFEVIAGHAFWSPVLIFHDGDIWEAPIKEDQNNLADMFDAPFGIDVVAGDTIRWEVTWAETGTELAIGYNFP